MEKTTSPYVRTDYDREYNLMYIEVNPKLKAGLAKGKDVYSPIHMTNLAIYDLNNGTLTHYFKKENKMRILYYLYETGFNEKLNRMDFNEDISNIFNNKEIEKRKKADKLFILTKDPKEDYYEFWLSSRGGEDRQMVKSFKKKLDWRIDVFNRKLLFIQKLDNEVAVDAFEW